MYDRFLRLTKNIIGIIAIIYFFVPVILRFFTIKTHNLKTPSALESFLSWPIFYPVLHQYDIALAKNSPIYYLAFLVCLLLVCWACWLIVYYVVKTIFLVFKKV